MNSVFRHHGQQPGKYRRDPEDPEEERFVEERGIEFQI
jgi:hypothetical protein